MYRLELGELSLLFDEALIAVPRDGAARDWMNQDWVDVPQEIEARHVGRGYQVTGLTGFGAETGPHSIELLKPRIFTQTEVVEYLLAEAETTGQSRGQAVRAIRS